MTAESREFKDFPEWVITASCRHEKMADANAPAMFRFRPVRCPMGQRIAQRVQSAATRFVSRDSLRDAVFL